MFLTSRGDDTGLDKLFLSDDELDEITTAFVLAARCAVDAGFDGVEVHGAHGFLLSAFLTPLLNHRHDSFGGPLENRMRFPLKVVEQVKQAIPPEQLLLYRLGADDLDQRGLTVAESSIMAEKLTEAGVDIIDVSGAACGSRPRGVELVQGFFVGQAARIKQLTGARVIGVGGIKSASYANRIIAEGKVDLVAVGRGLMANRDWVRQARAIL